MPSHPSRNHTHQANIRPIFPAPVIKARDHFNEYGTGVEHGGTSRLLLDSFNDLNSILINPTPFQAIAINER